LINSETSAGKNEREFIQYPDTVLTRGDYDMVIVSPSMATGVSIEVQDVVQRVYGVFAGVSSTDADMAQALGRVRQPVERVVWCNKVGSNYSPVSRSTSALQIKAHLKASTSATISLVRSSLREDTIHSMGAFDWENDPHLILFARIEAERNRAMVSLRDALRIRLTHEGNTVTVYQQDTNPAIKGLLKETRDELKTIEAEAIANAPDLSLQNRIELEAKESLTPEERYQLQKARIRDFYVLEAVTVEDVRFDAEKRRQREIVALENLMYPEQAIEKTVKSIQRQEEWENGIIPWDIAPLECQRWLRDYFGLQAFMDPHKTWSRLDLVGIARRIRKRASDVKIGLHFTISADMSDVQVVHQLLSQMGIKIAFNWSRSIPGLEGQKEKLYRIDEEHWTVVTAILHRREQRREQKKQAQAFVGSPPSEIDDYKKGGDPSTIILDTSPCGTFHKADVVKVSSSLGLWEVVGFMGEDMALIRQINGWANALVYPKPISLLQLVTRG
jgi:hypothetical protein